MSEPAGLVAALKECRTVLISVHKNPDGDALGSQLGLMLGLEKIGKEVYAHNLDPVPEIYRFLPGTDRITTGPAIKGTYDAFLVLDADPPTNRSFQRVLAGADPYQHRPSYNESPGMAVDLARS